jgi:invasion protein IalB
MRHSIWLIVALLAAARVFAAPASTQDAKAPALIYTPWTKLCAKPADQGAKQVCFTGKYGRLEAGTPVVAAALLETEGVVSKTLRVVLPLGMQMPQGIRIILDQGQPLNAPYLGCWSGGCIADFEATGELIGKLRKGQDLAVQGINSQGQKISVPLPLGDFAKALDGPATDPNVLDAQQRKSLDDMQSMAVPPDTSRSYPSLVYSPWTKFCLKSQEAKAKEVCFTGKDGRVEPGMSVVAAVVIRPAGDEKIILRVTLPLGVQNQLGTKVVLDRDQPMKAPYIVCLANGCLADYDSNTELIGRLKNSQRMVVKGINGQGQEVSLSLPLDDFAKAYDGPPTDPKLFEARKKQLQEDLQKRAEDARQKLEGRQPAAAP